MNSKAIPPVRLSYPDVSISEAVLDAAEKNGKKAALTYLNKSYSYGQLRKKVCAVAQSFCELGVKRGERVLVCLPNVPQAVYVLYGLNLIGAVAAFVSPLSGEEEFKTCLRKCRCRFAVVLDTVFEKFYAGTKGEKNLKVIVTSAFDEVGAGVRFISKLKSKSSAEINAAVSWQSFLKLSRNHFVKTCPSKAEDTAVILFSGGTTGTPKAVEITNLNLNALAVATEVMCCRNVHGVRMLSVLPVFHGFGLGITIHTALFFSGEALLVPRFDKEAVARLMLRKKPDYIACVPSMLKPLMSTSALKKADLSFLSGVFSGGDSLSKELRSEFDSFLENHGADIKIRQGYGATECVAAVTLMPDCFVDKESCGVPYPDTQIRIISPDTGKELPIGEVGEICISGKTVMKGYLFDEEETAAALKKDSDGRIWLHTGDLGFTDSDGFLYFKQRLKRMIISNGFNIYPSMIEQIALKNPMVEDCCVVGVPDPVKQQVAVAFVVLKSEIQSRTEIIEKLSEGFAKELTKQALPKAIFAVDSIPTTPLGKADYQKLEKLAIKMTKTADL